MNMYRDMLAIPRVTQDSGEPFLPPGYRFHPTDEELVVYYLANKVADCRFTVAAITEVDLNKCEPWDLPEKAKMGEKEWYFFSLKDRKYPTGLRTNRATDAGYWKATGKDREVMNNRHGYMAGMKKTLVFYKGRAPKGEKTNWVMHEYRLEGESSLLHLSRATKDEWVVCRIFKKNSGAKKTPSADSEAQCSLPALLESPRTAVGAEDSGVTDCEMQRDALSYVANHSSTMKHSDNFGMWLPRSNDIADAAARYPEQLPYINRSRTDQLAQNWSGLPHVMGGAKSFAQPSVLSPSATPAPFPASGFALKALLEQYSNPQRACKIEPPAVQTSPQLTFKPTNVTAWSSDTHQQFEALGFANDSHTPISASVCQIPGISCLNTHVSSNDHRIGRSIVHTLPRSEVESLWNY